MSEAVTATVDPAVEIVDETPSTDVQVDDLGIVAPDAAPEGEVTETEPAPAVEVKAIETAPATVKATFSNSLADWVIRPEVQFGIGNLKAKKPMIHNEAGCTTYYATKPFPAEWTTITRAQIEDGLADAIESERLIGRRTMDFCVRCVAERKRIEGTAPAKVAKAKTAKVDAPATVKVTAENAPTEFDATEAEKARFAQQLADEMGPIESAHIDEAVAAYLAAKAEADDKDAVAADAAAAKLAKAEAAKVARAAKAAAAKAAKDAAAQA